MNTDIFVFIEHLRGQAADISYVMLAAARELSRESGGKVTAVMLGYQTEPMTRNLAADRVLVIDQPEFELYSPDLYLEALVSLIRKDPPRLFLMGYTSIGMDLICGLGVRLDLPIVSQCQRVMVEANKFSFESQIYGGKITAQGELPEPAVLVSMVPGGYKAEDGKSEQPPAVEMVPQAELGEAKVKLVRFIEPDETDVDISKQSILVAVGRGLQNQMDLEYVEEFAQVVGGTVAASRPIIDQGWLPSTRLVGKSGKKVAPKFYLVLGISGAPEHVEGILDSDLIIAVNTDPNAPIFDVAHYGATLDLMDLLPALTETATAGIHI